MLMTRLPNEPEEEEPKTTDPRRRLELGNAEPGEPKTDVPEEPKPKKRPSASPMGGDVRSQLCSNMGIACAAAVALMPEAAAVALAAAAS